MQDTVMYFAYVSPQGSTIYNNLNEKNGIVLLESNIADVKFRYPDSYFFLAGDLNARTKDFIDFIPNDDLQTMGPLWLIIILLQVNFLLKYQIFRLKIAMRAFISPFIVSSHFHIKILHHILEINPRTDRHKIT